MYTPKFGSLTNPSVEILKEIKSVQRMEFDYVEIGIEEPKATPKILMQEKENILNFLTKNKMSAIGHTAYWVHFGSSHEKARKGWIEEAKDMINTACSLKLLFLNFHFYGGYGLTGSNSEAISQFTKNFVNSMVELSDSAKRKGVTLMLENMPKQEGREYGIKEFAYVIENTPNLMVHLDVAHAFTEGGMKRIKDYIRTFQEKIVHIHWHDNHGKEDEHLPLGRGLINHEEIVYELKKINYNKTITLEVFPRNKNIIISREKLKRLWEKV